MYCAEQTHEMVISNQHEKRECLFSRIAMPAGPTGESGMLFCRQVITVREVRLKRSLRGWRSAVKPGRFPGVFAQACRGNRTMAARLLGIDRASLWRKMKRHGLQAGQ
jgi:transcriptional regulator with AAA-type ATPase domain